MVFYAGLIVFYFFGDLFMSIYSSGCTNMDSQRAGTVRGFIYNYDKIYYIYVYDKVR